MVRRRGAGDGALYKRSDGQWIGRVDVPPGPDGKRRVKSVSSKDRATAAEKLRKLQADIAVGAVVTAPATTVGDWLDYWLTNIHRSKVKPGTREDYARIIRNHIKPRIGTKKLTNLLPEDVLAMQQAISATTTRTAQVAHHIVNRAMNDAVLWKRCTQNPAAVVPTPTHSKGQRQPFTADEVRRIIKAADEIDGDGVGPLLASRWVAAFGTGARKGEMLGLTWDRVDFGKGTIDLSWQLQQLPQKHGCGDMPVSGTASWPCGRAKAAYCPERAFDVDPGDEFIFCHRGLAWVRPKTVAGKRLTPMVPELARRLLAHREVTESGPHNLVWHHRDGRPISHKDDHELWQELLVRAGLREVGGPTIDQHRTRNTTLTMLLDAGVDPHIIDSTVGHSDVSMTRGYQYVDLSLARQAFDNLSVLLK
jgi:integrase